MLLMSTRDFIGYRGTRKKYTDLVLNCDDWRKSDGWKYSDGEDEYFGHGIYFFEENHTEAFKFAKLIRKYEEHEISIIKTSICCDRMNILDFLNGEVYQEYISVLTKTISDRFEEHENTPKFDTPLDCGMINYICKKQHYKLVRGPGRSVFRKYYETSLKLIELNVTRIQPFHIELCVRDIDIIKNFLICCA